MVNENNKDKLITLEGLNTFREKADERYIKRVTNEKTSHLIYVENPNNSPDSAPPYLQCTQGKTDDGLVANTVPLRGTNGELYVRTEPLADRAAASKIYVDSRTAVLYQYGDINIKPSDNNLFSFKVNDQTMTAEIRAASEEISGDIIIPYNYIKNNKAYSVTRFSQNAFVNCKNITSIVIPRNIVDIAGWAFSGCENISSITIPETIESIGMYAIDWDNKPINIYFRGTKEKWKSIIISEGNYAISSAIIHYNWNGVEQIYDSKSSYAQSGRAIADAIASINFPKEIKSLGERFYIEDFNNVRNTGIYTFDRYGETGYLIVLQRQGEDVNGYPALGPYQILIGWESPSEMYYRYETMVGEGAWTDLISFNSTLPNNLIYDCSANLNSDNYYPSVNDGTNNIEYNEDGSIYKSNAFKFTSQYIIVQTAWDDWSAIQTKFSSDGIFTRSHSEGENGPEWTNWKEQPTILTSPNGTKYKLSVSDNGDLTTTLVE